MYKRYFTFLLVILLSACGKPTMPPPTATLIPPTATATLPPTQAVFATVTPACISPEPTQADIDRALSYTGEVFPASGWEQSHSVAEALVAVTWQDASRTALVYLEARIKPCGYEEPDLNQDFNDENWKATFANYDSYQPIAQCRNDQGLRLYQFKAQSLGAEYYVNYWVQSDTDTRVIATMFVFPAEQLALLGSYSAQLFPGLPNCS